jgi:hypothetical protein
MRRPRQTWPTRRINRRPRTQQTPGCMQTPARQAYLGTPAVAERYRISLAKPLHLPHSARKRDESVQSEAGDVAAAGRGGCAPHLQVPALMEIAVVRPLDRCLRCAGTLRPRCFRSYFAAFLGHGKRGSRRELERGENLLSRPHKSGHRNGELAIIPANRCHHPSSPIAAAKRPGSFGVPGPPNLDWSANKSLANIPVGNVTQRRTTNHRASPPFSTPSARTTSIRGLRGLLRSLRPVALSSSSDFGGVI